MAACYVGNICRGDRDGDEQWALLEPLFPPPATRCPPSRAAGQKKLNLSKITYTVTNPSASAATFSGATVYIPDPDPVNAAYIAGSAKVATTPGWSAGHDATGIFASYSGSMVVGPGATVSTPALSASYSESGPAGTAIIWQAGQASLSESSPATLSIACTPTAPVGTVAQVAE